MVSPTPNFWNFCTLKFALCEMLNLKPMLHFSVQKDTNCRCSARNRNKIAVEDMRLGRHATSELSWREQQQPDIRQVISMLRLIRGFDTTVIFKHCNCILSDKNGDVTLKEMFTISCQWNGNLASSCSKSAFPPTQSHA